MGFIGSHLSSFLLQQGVRVLSFGRRSEYLVPKDRLPHNSLFNYVQLDLDDIECLPTKLVQLDLENHFSGQFVFYNLAWSGASGLSDLDVSAQHKNVQRAVNAYKVASDMGCTRFVHMGSYEEDIALLYREIDDKRMHNRHVIYGEAKREAREKLKEISWQMQTPLCLLSMAFPLGIYDFRPSLILSTLRNIIYHGPLEFTEGTQLFDVIPVEECARALYLIGKHGRANAEYFIGSGTPRTVREYVNFMVKRYAPERKAHFGALSYKDVHLLREVFSTQTLERDTGFKCEIPFEEACDRVYAWLKVG